MSYAQMGEKDNATLYLRALLKQFPKSEPAPAARKKLAELGG
jgi:TolA-binding protein